MIIVSWLLSGRIWLIEVSGNIGNSTPEILKYLKEEGITHGMKKTDVSCSFIEESMRENYMDITWVSAKLKNSTLTINVKEGVLIEDVHTSREPSDLAADKKGTIVKMVTRMGTPLKKVGDSCLPDEILVQGRVDIYNDSKEVIRYEYVAADADVYVKYKIPYYKELPLEHTISEETGKVKHGFSLQFGDHYLEFCEKKSDWRKSVSTKRIRITESFYLPVWYSLIEQKEYRKIKEMYTENEAKEIALMELHKFEENLIQKGVQIFVNNVTIKVNQKICVSQGYLEVIEKIGKSVPLVTQKQPNRKDIEE